MRQHKPVIPWLLVTAGAAVYWTVALGLGLPSFGRVLGVDEGGHGPAPADGRCVSVLVDGRPVAFGDCINVRFMQDSPDIPRPVGPRGRLGAGRAGGPYVGPDPEVSAPVWRPTTSESRHHLGRTSY
jgi:hypothetical protein